MLEVSGGRGVTFGDSSGRDVTLGDPAGSGVTSRGPVFQRGAGWPPAGQAPPAPPSGPLTGAARGVRRPPAHRHAQDPRLSPVTHHPSPITRHPSPSPSPSHVEYEPSGPEGWSLLSVVCTAVLPTRLRHRSRGSSVTGSGPAGLCILPDQDDD